MSLVNREFTPLLGFGLPAYLMIQLLTDLWFPASFKSSAAFDAINSVLQADDAERQNAIKNAKAIFTFTLTNEKGETESWYLDFKDKGVVGKGAAPEGAKADGELRQTVRSTGVLKL